MDKINSGNIVGKAQEKPPEMLKIHQLLSVSNRTLLIIIMTTLKEGSMPGTVTAR